MALLRWAGSKQRLLGELESRLPSDYEQRGHVELFAGSAAFYLHMRPAKGGLLVDTCRPLMTFFSVLSERPLELHKECCDLALAFSTLPALTYTSHRNIGLYSEDPMTVARSFWLVNQTCFNGLWRENAKGRMNVPIGSKRTLQRPDFEEFRRASVALCRAGLACAPWRDVLAWPGNAFVYVDPPYDEGFTQYQAAGWNETDLLELKHKLDELDKQAIPWMMSNADTTYVKCLFTEYRIEKVSVHRSMRPTGKRSADELIVRNY